MGPCSLMTKEEEEEEEYTGSAIMMFSGVLNSTQKVNL